jgi:hypothetical protein
MIGRPNLERRLGVICLTGMIAIVGASELAAQTIIDNLTTTYLESVARPQNFSHFVAQNQTFFASPQVQQHLQCIQQRMWQVAHAEIELCNSHTDPNWRYKCTQENYGAGMYFWATSVLAAIEGTPWADTWTGSGIIAACQWIAALGEDCESIFLELWPMVQPIMRQMLGCPS